MLADVQQILLVKQHKAASKSSCFIDSSNTGQKLCYCYYWCFIFWKLNVFIYYYMFYYLNFRLLFWLYARMLISVNGSNCCGQNKTARGRVCLCWSAEALLKRLTTKILSLFCVRRQHFLAKWRRSCHLEIMTSYRCVWAWRTILSRQNSPRSNLKRRSLRLFEEVAPTARRTRWAAIWDHFLI